MMRQCRNCGGIIARNYLWFKILDSDWNEWWLCSMKCMAIWSRRNRDKGEI